MSGMMWPRSVAQSASWRTQSRVAGSSRRRKRCKSTKLSNASSSRTYALPPLGKSRTPPRPLHNDSKWPVSSVGAADGATPAIGRRDELCAGRRGGLNAPPRMEPLPPPEPAPEALPAAAGEDAAAPHEVPQEAQAPAERASAAKPAARPRNGLAQTSLLLAGAAMLAAGVRALLKRRKRTPSDFGAIVSLLDVPGAPAPTPPSAPLPLAGLRFGIKDMCVRRRVFGAQRPFCASHGGERESLGLLLAPALTPLPRPAASTWRAP